MATGPVGHGAGYRPGRTELQPERPRPALGGRRHPVPHRRRLAPPRCGDRPVVSSCRGLGHGQLRDRRAGHRHVGHGVRSAASRPPRRTPLRSRRRLHVACVTRAPSPNSSSTSPSVAPVTATTTPRSNRSSRPSNESSLGSTPPRPGPPEPRSDPPCSTTSKASTTPNASNNDSGTAARSTTSKNQPHNNPCPPNRVNSTPGVAHITRRATLRAMPGYRRGEWQVSTARSARDLEAGVHQAAPVASRIGT